MMKSREHISSRESSFEEWFMRVSARALRFGFSTHKSKNAPESTRMARTGWLMCLGGGWKQCGDEERIEELLCWSGVLSPAPWECFDLNGQSSRLCCGARTLLWWLIWWCLANEWFMTWFMTLTTACDLGRKRREETEGASYVSWWLAVRGLQSCWIFREN